MNPARAFLGFFLAAWALVGMTCAAFETKLQTNYEQRKDISN